MDILGAVNLLGLFAAWNVLGTLDLFGLFGVLEEVGGLDSFGLFDVMGGIPVSSKSGPLVSEMYVLRTFSVNVICGNECTKNERTKAKWTMPYQVNRN